MHLFGFAGWSNAGKTTLIERLLPLLTVRGLRVSVIKHAHERFDIDRPGKDSFRFRDAGAAEVLVSSPARWALMHEHRGAAEPGLMELLAQLSPCDLALIEGWKHESMPKMEVHRPVLGKPLLAPDDARIVAIATDGAIETLLTRFQLDDIDRIADYVVACAEPFRPPQTARTSVP